MRRAREIVRPSNVDSGGSKVLRALIPGAIADSIVAPASSRRGAAS